MPASFQPRCPQCGNSVPLQQLWRVAPSGRGGIVLTGRIGILCPSCGVKLSVLQGRVRAIAFGIYAVFVGCICCVGLAARHGFVRFNDTGVLSAIALGFSAKFIILPSLSPRVARLRVVDLNEDVQFPLNQHLRGSASNMRWSGP
jgi:hypothetical protein